jgi:hypothetical protein
MITLISELCLACNASIRVSKTDANINCSDSDSTSSKNNIGAQSHD